MGDDGFDCHEDANRDVGRVMDEIKDIDGVMGIELTDLDNPNVGGGRIPWMNITLSLSVRPEGGTDE